MARRRRADAQSIDSLLDTMANVVGILVVLVAVTQLSLGDAIERIREQAGARAAATPDDLAALIGQRTAILDRIEMARSKLQRFAGEPRTGMRLADAEPLLDEFESLAGPSAAAGDLRSADEIANLRVEVERLEGDVAKSEGEKERLLAILAEPRPAEQSITIRLPDPRPVPVGLERVFFFCRGGEVHAIDLQSATDALLSGIRDATGDFREEVVVEPNDVPWIVNHFNKERIVDQGYRWIVDPSLHAALVPTDAIAPGEGESALRRPDSRIAAAIDALDPRRRYVRFFVWPDSYEEYLTARRLAETRGLRVGWTEMPSGEDLRFNLVSAQRDARNLLD